MTKERIPEHPSLVRERRETITGFVVAFGIVFFVCGTIALLSARGTETVYGTSPIPRDVRAALDSERVFGLGLMLLGGMSSAGGMVIWLMLRGPEDTSPP